MNNSWNSLLCFRTLQQKPLKHYYSYHSKTHSKSDIKGYGLLSTQKPALGWFTLCTISCDGAGEESLDVGGLDIVDSVELADVDR
jgi:hypothetical protein